MDKDKIVGFYLTHTVNGRSTKTRFAKKDLLLFKQWIDICKTQGFAYTAEAIIRSDHGDIVCRIV